MKKNSIKIAAFLSTVAMTLSMNPITAALNAGAASSNDVLLYGDVNLDGIVSIADAQAIEEYLEDSDNYALNAQGLINADVNKDDVVNQIDANLIRKYVDGSLDSFDYNFGDVDENGRISVDDIGLILKFITGQTPNEAQSILADVNGDSEINMNDADCLCYYLRYEPHQFRYLEEYTYDDDESNEEPEDTYLYGDANLDGTISIADAKAVENFIKDNEKYYIEYQGQLNADVNKDGVINKIDANLIRKYVYGSLDSFDYNFGDVNEDGTINVNDTALLCKIIAGQTPTEVQTILSDVNGDDILDVDDLDCLCYYLRYEPHQFRYLEEYTYDDDEPNEEPEDICLFGDANLDGTVSIEDAKAVEDFIKDNEKYYIEYQGQLNSDVNKDGVINQVDANLIRKYVNGSLDSFDHNFGDINADGNINIVDVVILKNIARFPFFASTDQKIAADVNGDNKINHKDIDCLIRYTRIDPHQFS